MPEENLELIVGVFESVNARDWQPVVDAFSDDTVLVIHADLGVVGTKAEGKPAVVSWFTDWFSQFAPDYRFQVDEVRTAPGGRVVLVATHHTRGRASGAPATQTTVYLYTLRDSKIVRTEVWAEREPAFEAAGLAI